MKGTVIMRFIGNRQEPEEEPVPFSEEMFFSPPMPTSELIEALQKSMERSIALEMKPSTWGIAYKQESLGPLNEGPWLNLKRSSSSP